MRAPCAHCKSDNGNAQNFPKSIDLTALDFFFWGHLKGKVYINKHRDLAELKREHNSINSQPNSWYFTKSHGKWCPKNEFVLEQ